MRIVFFLLIAAFSFAQDTTFLTYGTGSFTVANRDSIDFQSSVIVVEGNGPGETTITNTGNYMWNFRAPRDTLSLASSSVRGLSYIDVTDASTVSAGEILYMASDSAAETGWGYVETDIHTIDFIIGNRIYFTNPLNFNYNHLSEVVTIYVYRPRTVILRNLMFETSSGYELGEYFVNVAGCKLIVENVALVTTDPDAPDGLNISACVNVHLRNVSFDGFRYGCLMNFCRDFYAFNTLAQNCRHAYVPATWCDNVYVDGLVGFDNRATVDAHPSFNVTYSNVDARDTELSNCRAFGVIWNNVKIVNTDSHVQGYSYIGMTTAAQVADEYDFLFAEYPIILNNVNWSKLDNLGRFNGFSIFWAEDVIINNSTSHALAVHGGNPGGECRVVVNDCEFGRIHAKGANLHLSVKNTTIDHQLLPGTASQALEVDGTGQRYFENCDFVNFDNDDYLIEYLNSFRASRNRVFYGCRMDTFADIVKTYQYTNDYEIGFVNCKMVIDTSLSPRLSAKSYFIDCDTTFIE